MRQTKLDDILERKDFNEEWYSYEAPEELHQYNPKHPWAKGAFSKYGMTLLSVRLLSSKQFGNPQKDVYSKRKSLQLPGGYEISQGYLKLIQDVRASILIRTDGPIELAEIMEAYSRHVYDLGVWEVIELVVYNVNKGHIIEYRRHNPDGTRISLYIWRIRLNGKSLLYPEVSLSKMKDVVGKFRGPLSVCHWTPLKGAKVKGCVKKHKAKRTQTKRRVK